MNFKPLESVDYIAIHCSATPPDMDIGVKEITQWHKKRGFLTIGYHFVIRRDGVIEPGRPDDVMGAQVKGWNHCSIGICMVGGTNNHEEMKPQDNFTDEQWKSLKDIVGVLHAQHPKAIVQGHRDFPGVMKACPSFDVKPWFAKNFPDAGVE